MGDFRAQLTAKGRMSKLVENVPVAFVNYSETRLLGAAAALIARENQIPDPSSASRFAA
jgi:glucokinase